LYFPHLLVFSLFFNSPDKSFHGTQYNDSWSGLRGNASVKTQNPLFLTLIYALSIPDNELQYLLEWKSYRLHLQYRNHSWFCVSTFILIYFNFSLYINLSWIHLVTKLVSLIFLIFLYFTLHQIFHLNTQPWHLVLNKKSKSQRLMLFILERSSKYKDFCV